jgi:TPR repeat protein
MRAKACDGNIAHACFVLGSSMAADPVKGASLIKKACDAGEGPACLALATRFEDGLGVPKDPGQAKALYRQACDKGVAGGCVQAGQASKACELGDQPSCDTLCKTGDMIACKGASPDVRSDREAHHAKEDAEAAIPRLLARCASTRATILNLKSALSAAQGAHDDAKAQGIQDKLDLMRDPWGELKADLESAITTATGGSGPRFVALRQQARHACVGHD